MKKYSDEEKQTIIDYSNEHGLSAAKRKYNIWPETIRYWSRQDVRELHNKKALNAYHTRYKQDEAYKEKRREYYEKTKTVPYYKKALKYGYTIPECRRELINLEKSLPSYDSLPTRNRIIHTFQPHFFDIERELWKDKNIRKNLIENRSKYLNKTNFTDREILRGFKISGIHIGYSHFSPLWLTKFVKDHKPSIIYDPCGGWGHRMIGAHISNVNYIYNDKWDKTFNGCMGIRQFLNRDYKMYNEDCTQFTPDEDYDCIFTCPPYDNTEIYNNDLIEDYDLFLRDMFKSSIKSCTEQIGVVINKPYIDSVIKACPFKCREIYTLGTTQHSSHLNKTNSRKGEYLIYFTK